VAADLSDGESLEAVPPGEVSANGLKERGVDFALVCGLRSTVFDGPEAGHAEWPRIIVDISISIKAAVGLERLISRQTPRR